jgi:hypothetical protein
MAVEQSPITPGTAAPVALPAAANPLNCRRAVRGLNQRIDPVAAPAISKAEKT